MSSVQLDIRTLSDRLVDVVRDFILSGVIASERSRSGRTRSPRSCASARFRCARRWRGWSRTAWSCRIRIAASSCGRCRRRRPRKFTRCASSWSPTPQRMPACAPTMRIASGRARRWRKFDIDAAAQKPTVGALNRAFHLALVRPGGQRITTNIVARLHVLADRYVRKHLEPKGRVPATPRPSITRCWTHGSSGATRACASSSRSISSTRWRTCAPRCVRRRRRAVRCWRARKKRRASLDVGIDEEHSGSDCCSTPPVGHI